ncbi:MAG: RNA polymerase sigma factor [Candidatus Limnocylindria bacterium]|jgi:RNA polymerase sigma-70 factor (ECF subfamily)
MESVMAVDQREVVARRIEQHVERGYRLARAILADDREAEDAVQDACLAAWQRADSLRDGERFEPWFERILINGCRDRIRRRQRQRVRAIALEAAWRAEGEGSISDPMDRGSDRDLDAAFDRLDADHRIVVLLRYWQDLTLQDIAARLDVPEGTVKSRLHYALRTMRTDLEASHG